MKKVGFSKLSSILLMLPLKFIVFANIKVTREWKIEARENSRAGCRVKCTFFAIWLWELAYCRESQRALVVEYIKKFWTTLFLPKWKLQGFDRIAREPSNMVKAREQSKKLNYTDPFKIDHITLHGIFARFKVSF